MSSFVESWLETVADSAAATERAARRKRRARRLLTLLADKKNILITTHQHPDPDALASSHALKTLLEMKLPSARISMSIKGQIAGGINSSFTKLSNLTLTPWDEQALHSYDAIVLLDVQPHFAYSPLPPDLLPTAVIDHHRAKRRSACPFWDVRSDVGAAASIVFSYFLELQAQITPELAATLLFGIESDLAGMAGQPGELDNMALASLVLLADTTTLYKMRYVDLPQSYYVAYADGLRNAVYYDNAIVSHLEKIESLEKPALLADFLLRFEPIQWSLVTGVSEEEDGSCQFVLSLRTNTGNFSAAKLMGRLLRHVGEGGGHRSKAGGVIKLENGTPTEVERVRKLVRRRYLRALGIKDGRGQKLIS